MTKVLDGKEVRKKVKAETKEKAEAYREQGIVPKLVVLRIGEDPASVAYEKSAIKQMESVSIDTDTVTLPEDATSEEAVNAVTELNNDDSVHGIIVMQPLPEQINRNDLSEHLDPKKDVDALNPLNLGLLIEGNEKAMAPSTAQAVMEILDFYDIDVEGKVVTVIGSSPIVGKPISIMLSVRNATVLNTNIFTPDNKDHTTISDIVISATGALGMVDSSYINEGAIVIDVGFGYNDDGEAMGDVQYDDVFDKASAITPVPGGVGSVTTAILGKQLIKGVGLQTGK